MNDRASVCKLIFEWAARTKYMLLTQKRYYHWNKCFVNLRHPKLYTEKLNYLRLHQYYNNPKITECVDKCEVKNYLRRLGKEELCAATYDVYGKASQIDWDCLPEQFIIKCNHGSGYNYVCRDKASLDINKAVKMLDGWMKEDYWKKEMELVYKNIRKKILVEEYLGDSIETYRVCCFSGVPKLIYIVTTLNGKDYWDFYDLKWKKIKVNENIGSNKVHEKPNNLEKMLELAEELSQPFEFVRVDFYEAKGKVYFSEFTFLPSGGYFVPWPEKYNRMWGRWIKI